MITDTTNDTESPAGMVVPILEERLKIGTRLVEAGRALVNVSVSKRDETVEALLMRQDVSVDRVPIGTIVTAAPEMRREGDTVIVPILEERLVTETRLFLVEEIRIRITEAHHLKQHTATLRTETAEVSTDKVNERKEQP